MSHMNWCPIVKAAKRIGADRHPGNRVFFSYHHERDVWRANLVRDHWLASGDGQVSGGFEGSLAELAEAEGADSVRRRLDAAIEDCAVVCVLIGAETHQRHWVDYAVFRAITRGKGVFGVRIHTINDRYGRRNFSAQSPFDFLGFGTDARAPGAMVAMARHAGGWEPVPGIDPVSPDAAPYLRAGARPTLAAIFRVHDWGDDAGDTNFAHWVNAAAAQAGH